MIRKEVPGGELVIDPTGATVVDVGSSLVVDIPVQYRRKDGVIDVGSVYLGTEDVSVAVREAHMWALRRAHSAHVATDSGTDA